MANYKVKTKDNSNPKDKPRVYFTCHPADFEDFFDKVCSDIFATHDCAIYYTEDMNAPIDEGEIDSELGQMNLFVVPVTFKLMREENRTMRLDLSYAKEKNMAILPLMMEQGIDTLYSQEENFGNRQYLMPPYVDKTSNDYTSKLKKYLDTVLVGKEMAERIRAAFDAYIFLSYRKKDRAYAAQLMKIIHSIPKCRDIAIWYDEFLTPGESFVENIESAMKQSKLFTLLVTPNILEEDNYVLREEYPLAKRMGMDILPTEMEKTNRERLNCLFDGIPSPLHTDDERFSASLIKMLEKTAKSENDGDTEHNFLIGLAYLDGIDVEIDFDRAVRLISECAEAGLPEAMEKMYSMCIEGKGIAKDHLKAAQWAKRLYEKHNDTHGEESSEAIKWLSCAGESMLWLGEYDEAYKLFKIAYEASVKLYGKTHEESVRILYNCASALRYVKDTNSGREYKYKAYELAQAVFDLRVKLFGEDHPDTADAANLVGVCASNVDSAYLREATYDWYEYAYSKYAKIYGENHRDTLTVKANIGYEIWKSNPFTVFLTDENKKGLNILREAYEQAKESLGELDDKTLYLMWLYAHCLSKSKLHSEATSLFEQYAELYAEVYGKNSYTHISAISELYSAYFRGHKYNKALKILIDYDENYYATHGEYPPISFDYLVLYFVTGRLIKFVKAAVKLHRQNKAKKAKNEQNK